MELLDIFTDEKKNGRPAIKSLTILNKSGSAIAQNASISLDFSNRRGWACWLILSGAHSAGGNSEYEIGITKGTDVFYVYNFMTGSYNWSPQILISDADTITVRMYNRAAAAADLKFTVIIYRFCDED